MQAELEREPEVDALLLDLDMPGMDGLTGLALLRSDHPAVPIIVVSAAREPAVIRRAYEFGASAYIDKSASLDEIARIVRAVLAGEIFAPPEAAPADSFAQRAAQLTPQQWRVLALMVQGDQNKQIAHKLGVGEATVKAHVTVILRKLGVRSRTQAVIEARGLALPASRAGFRSFTLRSALPSEVRPLQPLRAGQRQAQRAQPQQGTQRGGLHRLVQQLDLTRPRPQPQRRIAIGSDQGRRHDAIPGAAQRVDDIETVRPFVKVEIGQHQVGQASRRARSPSSASACEAAVATRQPQPPSRVAIASRTRASLSMQSTKLSASTAGVGCGAGDTTGADTTAATRGTVTEKVEPRPGAEASSTVRSSMRAMRSTMARPRPSPRSSRGASSSTCRRTNSSKMTACLSTAMPGPLSLTSMRSSSPTRRQPSSTRAGRPSALP